MKLVLVCTILWPKRIVINFKFCHRSYNNKGGIEDDGEVTDEENEYKEDGNPNIMKKEVEKEENTKKK